MASKKFKKLIRSLVLWGSVIYLLILGGVLCALEQCTERQWYFGALLYLPPLGWLLPLMILTPLALLVRPWVSLLHLAAGAAVIIGYEDRHGPGSRPSEVVIEQSESNAVLTIITANIGQRPVKPLLRFIDESQPDVIAFQEAIFHPKEFVKQNPDYALRSVGQFTLASRLPIRNYGSVPDPTFEGRPVAAWFELGYLGRTIVIYSVHMPSPRAFLNEFRGSKGKTGGALVSEQAQEDFKSYWTTRFDLIRRLLAVLQNEKRPMLVVGDFNTPDHGGLYRLLTSQLRDSFAVAGSGGGDTFPANTRGGLLQFGAWMRLDYLFAGQDWIPIECKVEPPVYAQHLAVVGRFELLESEPEVASASR